MDIYSIYKEFLQVAIGFDETQSTPNQRILDLISETVSNLEWDCGKSVSNLTLLEASGFLGRLSGALEQVSSTLNWGLEKQILDLETAKIKGCLGSLCIYQAKEHILRLKGVQEPQNNSSDRVLAI